jgi:hypothetical protein
VTQPPLDGIDWTDLCDLGAELMAAEPDPRDRDLHGQGLTPLQLHTMTDIEPRGDYL